MRQASISSTLFFLLTVCIAIVNISPHTFLTGWDNLHPEFNLPLNISRSIFAVWEEYQGVGLLGGMGHASELVHQLLLLLFSIVLPTNILRYAYTFLMLFLGTTGTYVFIFLLNKSHVSAFLGGLFYICNLVTIQLFFVPLEVFTTQYGFLPWILAGTFLYIKNSTKRNLFLLTIILLLSTPEAYVQTVFFISLGALTVLLLIFFLYNQTLQTAKKIATVFLLVFLINSFWLLPFLYFFTTHAQIPVHAKINEMTTESIFLQNKEFGFLPDVMLLKGYLFNDIDPGLGGTNLMMHTWRDYFANPFIDLLGFVFFATILLGAVTAWKKYTPLSQTIVVLFIISFTALATATPPFSWINMLIRDHVPLVGQAYRFPFTKFGILAGFSYSVLFANGVEILIKKLGTHASLRTPSYILIAMLLFVYVFPIFTGHFFYEKERLIIPQEYFQLFNFFDHQDPSVRIANLPQYTYWSWEFYRFGYSGSGFPWYGIPQPMMDRAFDPWSSYNQNYYFELSHAIYAQDPKLLESVLSKYQISFITVDKNQYNPEYPLLFINPNIDTLLSQVPSLHRIKTFGNISVYAFSSDEHPTSFVYLTPPLPHINASTPITDTFYQTYGTYIADTKSTDNTIYFPFSSLGTDQPSQFSIMQHNSSFTLSSPIPDNASQQALHITNTPSDMHIAITPPENSSTFALTSNTLPLTLSPGVDGNLSVHIQNTTKPYTYASITPKPSNTPAENCDTIRHGTTATQTINSQLRITSYNATVCATYTANFLSHTEGYVVSIPVKHLAGRGLHVWIANDKENFSVMDTYLPEGNNLKTYTFVIPPLEPFSTSYQIRIANISIGSEQTINEIGKISMYPIPYDFLQHIYFSNSSLPKKTTDFARPQSIIHSNPSTYVLSLQPQELESHPVVVLSQGFDTGWKAYEVPSSNVLNTFFPFLFGKEITHHVLINNWENGWITPSTTSTIVLLYLPQFLEYVGFIFLIPTLLFIGFKAIRNR